MIENKFDLQEREDEIHREKEGMGAHESTF